VLDPAPAPVERVVDVGHIATGVHVRGVGHEALVDDDAVVEHEAARLEEGHVRDDADADDGEVRLDTEAALGLDVLERVVTAEARDFLLEQDIDPVLAVERPQLLAQLA
jgi:hypothetical protein